MAIPQIVNRWLDEMEQKAQAAANDATEALRAVQILRETYGKKDQTSPQIPAQAEGASG